MIALALVFVVHVVGGLHARVGAARRRAARRLAPALARRRRRRPAARPAAAAAAGRAAPRPTRARRCRLRDAAPSRVRLREPAPRRPTATRARRAGPSTSPSRSARRCRRASASAATDARRRLFGRAARMRCGRRRTPAWAGRRIEQQRRLAGAEPRQPVGEAPGREALAGRDGVAGPRRGAVGLRLALQPVQAGDAEQRGADVHLGHLHLEAHRGEAAHRPLERRWSWKPRMCECICRPMPSSGTSRVCRSRTSRRAPRACGPALRRRTR